MGNDAGGNTDSATDVIGDVSSDADATVTPTCETDPSSIQCTANGGQCVNASGLLTCVCPPGLYGATCGGTCDCQNGGTCNDGAMGDGSCTCAALFYDTNCARACNCPADQICADGATQNGACSSCSDTEFVCNNMCKAATPGPEHWLANTQFNNTTSLGQTFITRDAGTIVSASAMFLAANDKVRGSIINGHGVAGTVLATVTIDAVDGEQEFVFDPPVAAAKDGKYTFLLERVTATGALYRIRFHDRGTYADGAMIRPNGSVSSTDDLQFRTKMGICP